MAAIQPFVNLQPFKGTQSENIEEFFRQLASSLQVANMHDDNRHQYLYLHLKSRPITFFDQFQENTRIDLNKQFKQLETASRMIRESNFKNLSSIQANSNLQMNQPKTS